ncbi:nitrogen regulatory protein PII 2 [Clostridium saccharoperbutylacetonicum]|uniref:Nitrogen regulatory protein P-II family n=1 Tax=Clostridium saccharoperbutylacetonicum N1-4(HMT) TaxID=931276 RepID=M1MKN1_9CLOT|nr:P-II family nitrogen regulator [Clostridium saccharoperbutylacetonicum]AGF56838.1 nitrogen regulatory protein P-II family [Clostridium saccharoperbutylacetonicum N1-4(HMT)]NRT62405.1 nitrogen regulatory protein PII 2 [Clostridium saccharoperbutylacetonicum]NSB25745.1 nitrogen regulatory protein PII 2 [Clostridium saccharoperbutylacetonicum]NSB45111.1 nitrogen regulatory protein PII 2 [Clostridium saccharoperbutylacetonicum]
MKEVMCIIRLNKVNKTKEALAEAGFPSITCRKVLGRGKKSIDKALLEAYMEAGEVPASSYGENLSERGRLIPKRLITLVVKDDEVKNVVDTVISVNSTGTPGDGKIFVLPVEETYRVRDGKAGEEAI